MRAKTITLVAFICACGGEVPVRPRPSSVETDRTRRPLPTTLSVSAAKDIVARAGLRTPGACETHCGGAGKMVRLRLEDERDYRLVLLDKHVGERDEFHISNGSRDMSLTMVQNADVGTVIALRGPDTLQVCTKPQMENAGCEFRCDYDPATSVVKMTTSSLAASLAVFCF